MAPKKTYRLTRRLPDGTVKTHSTSFPTRRRAAQAAFYVLVDNRAANPKDATKFPRSCKIHLPARCCGTHQAMSSQSRRPSGPGKFEMCEACSGAWMRWLDYTLPPEPIRIDASYVRTVRDIEQHQERRYHEWRDTVRFEQDLIRKNCREGRHVKEAGDDGV